MRVQLLFETFMAFTITSMPNRSLQGTIDRFKVDELDFAVVVDIMHGGGWSL